ncbi:MAG TPA: peptidyl-alpha-hydroxyglycine alpha-amidating lyase family protein [Vicinamibacterales bacterium]|nr:peptidyl-alpha-hydroxyglycine alpha-amidating lyase family protein [Vicinamibacterales bacterium]
MNPSNSRTFKGLVTAAALACGVSLVAQSAPDIPFDANADLLKLPDNIHLGEVAGVATNSKGHIFVYTRTGAANATVGSSRTFYKAGSRLLEFDASGKFLREIGQGLYGLNFAQATRVDPQDNVWLVDQGSSNVMKFDPDGRLALVLSRKPEAISVRPAAAGAGRGGPPPEGRGAGGPPPEGRGAGAPGAAAAAPGGGRFGPPGAPGAGIPGDSFNRTADVTWDRAGNIYVADGASKTAGNARIAKFDKDGHFIKSWGSRGSEPGQFNGIHGIVIDAQGNLYVADAGNQRIQVFDADGNVKAQITNVGTPSALCITPITSGAHQYLYSSNSNDPETLDNGEIYKLELNGRIVGKFGRAGKLPKEFGMVNSIDCRSENELFVGELTNWRVQKVTLRSGQ